MTNYSAHLGKWREDVADEDREVQNLEDQLSKTGLQLRRLYIVEMLLGIALVVGSFATLTRQSWIGHVSLLLGLVGLGNLILAFR
jgi:hypothetical protein